MLYIGTGLLRRTYSLIYSGSIYYADPKLPILEIKEASKNLVKPPIVIKTIYYI